MMNIDPLTIKLNSFFTVENLMKMYNDISFIVYFFEAYNRDELSILNFSIPDIYARKRGMYENFDERILF